MRRIGLVVVPIILILAAPLICIVSGFAESQQGVWSCIVEYVWNNPELKLVDISRVGYFFKLVADGQSYSARQVAYNTDGEKRLLSVSKERGPTDIIIARRTSSSLFLYLFSEDGKLRMAGTRTLGADRLIPDRGADRDFQEEKAVWVRVAAEHINCR